MPWHDWQFWLVTALVMITIWRLARAFIPATRSRKAKGRRADLTIEGRSV